MYSGIYEITQEPDIMIHGIDINDLMGGLYGFEVNSLTSDDYGYYMGLDMGDVAH